MFQKLGINFLDIIIVVVVFFYAHEGYVLGFTIAFLDLASFILSFITALKIYGFVGKLLINAFSMPLGFANALGFFLTAFVMEIFLSILFRRLLCRFPIFIPSVPAYRLFKR